MHLIFITCFLNFSPWNDAPYKDAAEKTDMGYISLNGFLSQVDILLLSFILQSSLLDKSLKGFVLPNSNCQHYLFLWSIMAFSLLIIVNRL